MLIHGADRSRSATAVVASHARDRVLGVVNIMVRPGLGSGRFPGESSVAPNAIGLPATVEIQVAIGSSCQGIFLFVAPLVDSHNKELYGRLVPQPTIDPLQPVIKPAQFNSPNIQQGLL